MSSSRADVIKTVIDRYDVGGRVLTLAVEGLTLEHGQARPGPGDWSIAEVVAHLVDADLILADRMKRVIGEEDPPLIVADETAWVVRLGSNRMPLNEATSLFDLNRHWMTCILRHCDSTDFARVGTHSTAGRQSLAELLVIACNHLDHHLRFVYIKRANLGVAVQPRYSREQNQ